MRELILTDRLRKSFAKYIKKHPLSKDKIFQTLDLLRKDVYSPHLYTHKLSGALIGLKACSCGFYCRILFSVKNDSETEAETIILLDIGTHEELY